MSGVNKVIIVGRLGADPDFKESATGNGFASLSVATSDSWTDKESGERKEKTEWHRVKLFGKLAELADKYLSKGSQVYIEGKLETSSYEKEGTTRYSTAVIANQMTFLSGRKEESEASPQEEYPNSEFGQAAQGEADRNQVFNHAPGADNPGF